MSLTPERTCPDCGSDMGHGAGLGVCGLCLMTRTDPPVGNISLGYTHERAMVLGDIHVPTRCQTHGPTLVLKAVSDFHWQCPLCAEPAIPLSVLRGYLQWLEEHDEFNAPLGNSGQYYFSEPKILVPPKAFGFTRAKAELLARIPALKETT